MMGNRLEKHEVVFMTSERTTKVVAPDGSRLVLHKEEIFEKDKLKYGNYSAERHNPLTGGHQQWFWTSQPRPSNPRLGIGSPVDLLKPAAISASSKQPKIAAGRNNPKPATCPDSGNSKLAPCPDSVKPQTAPCPDSVKPQTAPCPDSVKPQTAPCPDSVKPQTAPCPDSVKTKTATGQTTDCRTYSGASMPSGDINEENMSDAAFVWF